MDRKNALDLLKEIYKNNRYWLPNDVDRKILEDIDWRARIDKESLNPAETKELLRIYKLTKEASA